jgi:hypothetical protein
MRWNEIIREDINPVQQAKGFIMDILAPLKAQGVGSITVQQVIQQMQTNPDFEGMSIEPDLINQAINGVNGLKVEPDPQTNQMSIFIDNPQAGRQVDQKQAEKDDKAVHSAAMRTIAKKDTGGL